MSDQLQVHLEWDDWSQQLFLSEVASQCSFAAYAWDLYERSLYDPTTENPHLATDFAIHALLAAFANLSKLLDPIAGRQRGDSVSAVTWRVTRGAALRDLLKVPPDSPILEREMRNRFEHIDEYLDRWIIVQPRFNEADFADGKPPVPAPIEPRPPLREIRAAD